MEQNLFSKVNINRANIHIPNGCCKDPDAECEAYEAAIEEAGGIDLQILGIGQNGHIGFNEPSRDLNTSTHLTDLTESTIEANSRFFASVDDVPKKALTMGISTILKSKKIVLMACGASKRDAVRELFNEDINTDVPATLLKVHLTLCLSATKRHMANNSVCVHTKKFLRGEHEAFHGVFLFIRLLAVHLPKELRIVNVPLNRCVVA